MAWWALGAVSAIAGILVYMELGLTIPIYRIGGIEVSVPRSGGELNYVCLPPVMTCASANIVPSLNTSSESLPSLPLACSALRSFSSVMSL